MLHRKPSLLTDTQRWPRLQSLGPSSETSRVRSACGTAVRIEAVVISRLSTHLRLSHFPSPPPPYSLYFLQTAISDSCFARIRGAAALGGPPLDLFHL